MTKKGLISHVEIYVSDLTTTTKFWSWLLVSHLNYKIYQQWDKGISFILDDTYLVFVQTDQEKLAFNYNRTYIGLNHLAFYMSSKHEIDDLRQELADQPYKELYADRYPYAGGENYYALYFEDPDRIKVEVTAAE